MIYCRESHQGHFRSFVHDALYVARNLGMDSQAGEYLACLPACLLNTVSIREHAWLDIASNARANAKVTDESTL